MLCVISLLAASCALGQATSTVKAKNDYSKEPFVIEKSVVRVIFQNDGTWTRDTEGAIRMQSEAGVQRFGVLVLGYSSSNNKIDIGFVRVRKADGTTVVTAPENIQDLASDVSRQAPMYSDYREKHVAVKGLGVGDTLEFALRLTEDKPIIPQQFWTEYTFSRSDITLDEEVEISVPKDRKVNLKSPALKPETSESGQWRRYFWKTSTLERPADAGSKRKDAATPSIQLSSFGSWSEVARWWGALEEHQVQPSPEIRAKAAELTKNVSTDSEKLHAIYNYVATRFRYISLSFGIGRYQPHAAEEVLRNEYGDCKDKHTLLEALLRASGIYAYPVLISVNRKIDTDVPSPAQFDHVITVVPSGHELIWLDTTAEVAPFGFILSNLRGKFALVVAENKPTLPATAGLISAWRAWPVIPTPSDPPFKSAATFEIDAKLDDDGTLRGKIQRTWRGDFEVILRSAFRQTPQTQWKDLVQQLSYSWGFGGDVSEVSVSAPEDTVNPFVLSYNYARKEYPDWTNKRISVPSPIQGIPVPADDKSASPVPIELDGPLEISSVSRVQMPPGYTPDLRSPVDIVSDFAEFHAKYGFAKGIFTAEYRLYLRFREISPPRFPDYQDFAKNVNDKIEGYTAFSLADAVGEPSDFARAESLLHQAALALQSGKARDARGLLEDAVKADPKNTNAWIALGQLQLSMHQTDEGVASLYKAMDTNPNDFRAYKLLSDHYVALKRQDDAIALAHSVLKGEPDCFECHAILGDLLFQKKQFSDAISEYEAAGKLNPGSARAPFSIARAFLGLGDADKALAAFSDATDLDHSPGLLNDTAWYLADAGQKLPAALKFAQKAVKTEEAEASDVDLDTLSLPDVRRMVSLVQYWDTLGWVYFRQGDFARATKYIYAAWYLGQMPIVGSHLAQIYEKQGRRTEAIRVCAMAVAVNEQETNSQEYFEKLVPEKTKRDALVKAGANEVSEMRHYRITRTSGPNAGSAEFFVLLATGAKAEEVKFISGEETLKPLAKEIQAIHFTAPLPDGSEAKLVRRGILMCTGTYCDFVLIPPSSVRSTK
jgi:tetratricopeptide (TPR) repeat protein